VRCARPMSKQQPLRSFCVASATQGCKTLTKTDARKIDKKQHKTLKYVYPNAAHLSADAEYVHGISRCWHYFFRLNRTSDTIENPVKNLVKKKKQKTNISIPRSRPAPELYDTPNMSIQHVSYIGFDINHMIRIYLYNMCIHV
jgi:hypothetical protein